MDAQQWASAQGVCIPFLWHKESNDQPVPDKSMSGRLADESCGKCTPCREGTPKMVELLKKINTNNSSTKDLEELLYISKIVKFASLCGLGQAAGNPVESFNYFFPNIITSNV